MILHENRLPADDSHEISCLICYFLKSSKIFNCRLLQIIGGAFRVKRNKRPTRIPVSSIDILCEAYLNNCLAAAGLALIRAIHLSNCTSPICKVRNFRKNFIFENSIKRHICNVKKFATVA